MKWHKIVLVALMAVSLVFVGGCTPARELKDMDIIESLGVDLLPDGEYQVTYQLFQSQTETGGEMVDILQTSGVNLFDASRNATVQTGKRLYYSNERVLVLGSEVCRQGLAPIIDFFTRNHELRMGQRVFMAEGRAADILTAKNQNGVITGKTLERVAQNEQYSSKIIDMQLGELLERMSTGSDAVFMPTVIHRKYTPDASILQSQAGSSPGANPGKSGTSSSSSGSTSSASGGGSTSSESGGGSSSQSGSGGGSSDLQNKEILEVERTAVFNKDGKFAAFLTSNQTRGFLWTRSGAVSGAVMITMPDHNIIGIEIKNNTANLTVQPNTFTFDIGVKGSVVEEKNNGYDVVSTKALSEITGLLNKEIEHEVRSALDVAFYGAQSDIFRIGTNYFRFRPDQWRTLNKNWPLSGKKLKAVINVHSEVIPHA